MTDKIYILDNGSAGSKLLQEEYKNQYDIKTVKVDAKADLVQQFTKIDNKDRIKIFLPFTVQDLVANNEKLRREIQKVESLGFKNLIVLPYEGRDKQEVEFKAKKLPENASKFERTFSKEEVQKVGRIFADKKTDRKSDNQDYEV